MKINKLFLLSCQLGFLSNAVIIQESLNLKNSKIPQKWASSDGDGGGGGERDARATENITEMHRRVGGFKPGTLRNLQLKLQTKRMNLSFQWLMG